MDHLERARDLIREVAGQLVTSRPDLSIDLNRALVLILHEETMREENREIVEYLKGPFQADYMRWLRTEGLVDGNDISTCLKRNIVKFKEFGQYDLAFIQEQLHDLHEARPFDEQDRIMLSMRLKTMNDIIYRRYGLDLMIG